MDHPEDRLALIEVLDRDGRTLRALDVHRWPVSLGRALDNALVLDDPYVAPHHARLDRDDDSGRIRVSAQASVNGLQLDGQALASPGAAWLPAAGGRLQLGHTTLRVRLRDEALEAELPIAAHSASAAARLGGLAAALVALLAAAQWVRLDPGADLTHWLPLLLGIPALLAAWCGGWALASKLFQHRFAFRDHLAVALPWFLGLELIELLLPQLAASVDAAWLWRSTGLAIAVSVALMVRSHLALVLPRHGRGVTTVLVLFLLLWQGVNWTLAQRQHDRLHAAPYMGTLPLSALRLGTAARPDTVLEAMLPLRERLQARVEEAARDEPDEDPAGE